MRLSREEILFGPTAELEQYYHTILTRKGWTTTPLVESAERGARSAECPPPPWAGQSSVISHQSLPPELAELAAKFDVLDQQHGR